MSAAELDEVLAAVAAGLAVEEERDNAEGMTYRLAALEALQRGDRHGAHILAELANGAATEDLVVLLRRTMVVERPHFAGFRVITFAPGDLG